MDQKLVLPLPPQMVNVSYHFVDVTLEDFNPENYSLWLKKVLSTYKVDDATLEYVFVTDDYLLEMNKRHLNHNYYTDIITFNYNEGNSLSGEMYLSVDRIRENALEFSEGDFSNELSRVMVHGVLHLLGYDDKTEEDELKIREQENICLSLK